MFMKLFILVMLIFNALYVHSQNNFYFEKSNRSKDKVNFNLVGNFTIIPVKVNGVELSFLLDTGVDKTIIFSLENIDSLTLENTHAVVFSGYGVKDPIKGFKSENNRVQIGKAISDDFTIYVIFDKENNFSPRLGVPIHGIMGNDFYKNFVVEVNYNREFVKFYEPENHDKKYRRYENKTLVFYDHKPYIQTDIVVNENRIQSTLMIDTGLGDGLWLYSGPTIPLVEPNFKDFLGLGFSGSVYGKRSKIDAFFLGKYKLNEITTAYPDSASTYLVNPTYRKNGLIGAEILKRFNLVFDYQGHKMWFVSNHFFDDPFLYNMSGLVLEYDGFRLVENYERVSLQPLNEFDTGEEEKHLPLVSFEVKFELKPQLKIVEVRPQSPAYISGLREGDIVLRVNGRSASHYSLIDLGSLFSSEVGRQIKMRIHREDVGEMKKKFRLKKVL